MPRQRPPEHLRKSNIVSTVLTHDEAAALDEIVARAGRPWNRSTYIRELIRGVLSTSDPRFSTPTT